jgi:putative FmdB family regulatory protein
MPLYEYECDANQHRFEVIQKFSDPPIETCPTCGSTVQKLLSSPAIQFKGSGWYITDYARAGKGDAGSGGKSDSPKGDAGTSDAGKGDGAKTDSTSSSADASSATKAESKSESRTEKKAEKAASAAKAD